MGTGTAEGLRPGEAELHAKRGREDGEAAQLEGTRHTNGSQRNRRPLEKGQQEPGLLCTRDPKTEEKQEGQLTEANSSNSGHQRQKLLVPPKCHLRRKRGSQPSRPGHGEASCHHTSNRTTRKTGFQIPFSVDFSPWPITLYGKQPKTDVMS